MALDLNCQQICFHYLLLKLYTNVAYEVPEQVRMAISFPDLILPLPHTNLFLSCLMLTLEVTNNRISCYW